MVKRGVIDYAGKLARQAETLGTEISLAEDKEEIEYLVERADELAGKFSLLVHKLEEERDRVEREEEAAQASG